MTSSVLSSSAGVLAYIPSPARGVWEIGPFPLRAYALFIIIGIVVAIYWGERRWMARGGEQGTVLDIAVWAVPFGLIGGRIYHVMTDWPTYFGSGKEPLDALKIWQGGLGIWGAVFFGALGAWIGCRRRGIPLPAFGDAIAPPILLAQAIGRLGNYFNQELYGRETTVPWGLEIYERTNSQGAVDSLGGESRGVVTAVVHPTFLYEMIWNLIVVGLLVFIDRRFKIGHGRLFALYVAGYCAGRFCIELMRADPASHIGGIRVNSFTSAIVFVLAVAYVVFAKKGREEPSSLLSKKERARRALVGVDKPAGDKVEVLAGATVAENTARVVESSAAVPEDSASGSSDKKATKVDVAKAGAAKVDAAKSKAAKADVGKVEAAKADTSKVEAANADTSKAASKADASKAGAARADTAKVDTAKADTAEAGAAKAGVAKVDAAKSAAGKVEADKTNTTKVEAAKPESKDPEPEKAAFAEKTTDSAKAEKKADVAQKPGQDVAGDDGSVTPADEPTDHKVDDAADKTADDDVVVEKPLGSLVERNSRRMRAIWQRRGRR